MTFQQISDGMDDALEGTTECYLSRKVDINPIGFLGSLGLLKHAYGCLLSGNCDLRFGSVAPSHGQL